MDAGADVAAASMGLLDPTRHMISDDSCSVAMRAELSSARRLSSGDFDPSAEDAIQEKTPLLPPHPHHAKDVQGGQAGRRNSEGGDPAACNNNSMENGTELHKRRRVKSSSGAGDAASGDNLQEENPDDEGNKDHSSNDGDRTDEFGHHVSTSCHSHHLLGLKDMPAHLQFNRHVHSGYRRLHDVWGCFWSLFYLHNETVNIFTHVLPIIWVLLFWRSMYPWEDIEGNMFLHLLGWSHVIASISPWLGSVTYHLFMNHRKGAKLYHLLLQLDMFGIWVTECFGALTNISASTWCLPGNLQTIIIVLYALGSVWGLHKALTAWTPLARRLCFAPVFTTRILGFFLRISRYGGGEPDVLIHVILQDAVSLVGGMIGVVRIPEKWFPGKLDLFCNSHHIMHVLVVLAVFHMNQATNGDIRWIIRNYSECTDL